MPMVKVKVGAHNDAPKSNPEPPRPGGPGYASDILRQDYANLFGPEAARSRQEA